MDRMANEVAWELGNTRAKQDRSEKHYRALQHAAERGYELTLDMKHGLVLFARELGVGEWNTMRADRGWIPAA
jgi:hypothetical protein